MRQTSYPLAFLEHSRVYYCLLLMLLLIMLLFYASCPQVQDHTGWEVFNYLRVLGPTYHYYILYEFHYASYYNQKYCSSLT